MSKKFSFILSGKIKKVPVSNLAEWISMVWKKILFMIADQIPLFKNALSPILEVSEYDIVFKLIKCGHWHLWGKKWFKKWDSEYKEVLEILKPIYLLIFFFFFFFFLLNFLAAQHCMWDLSCPTRDRTCAPCSGSTES